MRRGEPNNAALPHWVPTGSSSSLSCTLLRFFVPLPLALPSPLRPSCVWGGGVCASERECVSHLVAGLDCPSVPACLACGYGHAALLLLSPPAASSLALLFSRLRALSSLSSLSLFPSPHRYSRRLHLHCETHSSLCIFSLAASLHHLRLSFPQSFKRCTGLQRQALLH